MAETIHADMAANVWKVMVSEGDQVEEEDVIIILEAMKMEIPVMAEEDGTITKIHVQEEGSITQGDPLYDIEEE